MEVLNASFSFGPHNEPESRLKTINRCEESLLKLHPFSS